MKPFLFLFAVYAKQRRKTKTTQKTNVGAGPHPSRGSQTHPRQRKNTNCQEHRDLRWYHANVRFLGIGVRSLPSHHSAIVSCKVLVLSLRYTRFNEFSNAACTSWATVFGIVLVLDCPFGYNSKMACVPFKLFFHLRHIFRFIAGSSTTSPPPPY